MKLMIVGNLGDQLIVASKIATKNGARVFTVSDCKAALRALRDGKSSDLIMVDVNQDIKGFIEALKSEKIYATVVACGIENDSEKAVKAIKSGAKEYIPLPPEEDLMAAIFEAIAGSDNSEVVYKSEVFAKVLKMVDQIAPSEATVLITGESGTGKEVLSKYIHAHSKRKSRDLVSINCAAIPENLLESELFGHEKGAFTGAIERRIGKFEEANGSTLLLDEITEMDLKLQAKLLRAIQEREIVRVGGNAKVALDIRIIATTNKNMQEEVKAGRFREDLFYRLNVITINMPTLKERVEDIELLSLHFIQKYAKLNCIKHKAFSQNALDKLKAYKWPGNIRELENTVHRALLLATGNEITEADVMLIDYDDSQTAANSNEMKSLEKIEIDAIGSTMKKCYGDEVKAAAVLGISIRTLRNKLKQYKISAV
jgi:DNA-binding NtrC family response regulator